MVCGGMWWCVSKNISQHLRSPPGIRTLKLICTFCHVMVVVFMDRIDQHKPFHYNAPFHDNAPLHENYPLYDHDMFGLSDQSVHISLPDPLLGVSYNPENLSLSIAFVHGE